MVCSINMLVNQHFVEKNIFTQINVNIYLITDFTDLRPNTPHVTCMIFFIPINKVERIFEEKLKITRTIFKKIPTIKIKIICVHYYHLL